jgi:gas vesicle protein
MGNNSNERSSGAGIATWLIGLLLGVVGGATVALLTTPKSGNEVRGAIKKTAKDMPERMGELVDDSLDIYASALNYTQLLLRRANHALEESCSRR